MSITYETATQANDTFKKLLETEYPDLTLEFIFYDKNCAREALEKKRLAITRSPAGDICFGQLQKLCENEDNIPEFTGLYLQRKKRSLLLPNYKMEALGFAFICLDYFNDNDDIKYKILNQMWHGLKLFLHLQEHPNEITTTEDAPFTLPSKTQDQRAEDNMLADGFAGFLIAMTGDKFALKNIAENRCLKTIRPTPYYHAELCPYPIALDAIEVINKDFNTKKAKTTPVASAIMMTEEILHTIDEYAVPQWSIFAMPAQQMAWARISHKHILGAGIHHSDNVHCRVFASIIADTLNIEPILPVNYSGHDPFTNDGTNQARHKKAQENLLRLILKSALNKTQEEILYDLTQLAIEHNRNIESGSPVGWSSYPILRIIETLENSEDSVVQDAHALSKFITDLFHKFSVQIPWESIAELNIIIMDEHRANHAITGQSLGDIIQQSQIQQKELIAHAFSLHGNNKIRAKDKDALELAG